MRRALKRLAELSPKFGMTIDTADVGRTRLLCAPLPSFGGTLPGTLAPPTPRQIEAKYDWIRETNPDGVTEVIVTYSYAEMFGLAEARILFDADERFRLVDGQTVSVLDLHRGMSIEMADGTVGTILGNPERRYEIPVPPLPAENQLWTSRVVGRVKHTTYEVVEFRWGGQVVKVTPGHEVWSEDRRGWVGSHELLKGENIRVAGNVVAPVESIRRIPGMIDVFGIEIEYFHNYFVGVGDDAMLVHNGPQCIVKPAETIADRASFTIRGARRIDGLREATHADVVKAFQGTGFTPSSHFIGRVIDPRTSALGTRTFGDLQTIIRKGALVNAGRGESAFVHQGMAIVFDPKIGKLITLRPW
ncbi:MAG: hypothetical protein LC104_19805 [Bacteroidales bacterium]|nr:hypothetical protein [Bacteroidales bacterium]